MEISVCDSCVRRADEQGRSADRNIAHNVVYLVRPQQILYSRISSAVRRVRYAYVVQAWLDERWLNLLDPEIQWIVAYGHASAAVHEQVVVYHVKPSAVDLHRPEMRISAVVEPVQPNLHP